MSQKKDLELLIHVEFMSSIWIPAAIVDSASSVSGGAAIAEAAAAAASAAVAAAAADTID